MQKMIHQLAGSGCADLGNDLQGEEGEEVGRGGVPLPASHLPPLMPQCAADNFSH